MARRATVGEALLRAVVQRCAPGRVEVEGETVGEVARGLVVFAAVGKGDDEKDLGWVAEKVVALRLFADEGGTGGRSPPLEDRHGGRDSTTGGRTKDGSHFARTVAEIGGGVLVVPQFTLYGDARKGRRPSFDAAMPPLEAERMLERFVEILRRKGIEVATGRFGAMMRVEISNDGPVTILLDSKKTF